LRAERETIAWENRKRAARESRDSQEIHDLADEAEVKLD